MLVVLYSGIVHFSVMCYVCMLDSVADFVAVLGSFGC